MISNNLDQQLLLALNSPAAGYFDIWRVTYNSLFRGLPISFALVALWFVEDCRVRRSRMLAGLLAVCIATMLSVWSQFHLNVHTRPFMDPTLHLIIADPSWATGWDRTNSFPSDTATLFFGLAAVIFTEWRMVGALCFLWVVVVVAIPRIIFGFHYPSDILGAAILGPGCVFLFNRLPYLRFLVERILLRFEGHMQYAHALLFIFLADAFNQFQGLEQIARFFGRLLLA
jgi:membrane-associated phospholipid phosphatase